MFVGIFDSPRTDYWIEFPPRNRLLRMQFATIYIYILSSLRFLPQLIDEPPPSTKPPPIPTCALMTDPYYSQNSNMFTHIWITYHQLKVKAWPFLFIWYTMKWQKLQKCSRRKGFLPRQLYHMCTVQEMQGSNDMLAKPVYNKNNINDDQMSTFPLPQ